ncbi:hypothetical protein MMC07_001224 [Pseudocyphellaria aurata]|nr:hypothetical protein [Pseudocyphellaria aurata]
MAPFIFWDLAVAAALTLLTSYAEAASYNGLAITPQLGWNNWNSFGCDVSETLLLGTAEKIVDYGLRDLGYRYVILDDCWSAGRTPNGTLQANETKFPNGMAHVADKLHGMGFLFGMYSSAGTYTCAQYSGSLGKEKQDADTFAGWGVDYLKYDNCFNEGQSGNSLITRNRYAAMSQALNQTGRSILYSMCNWGEDYPWNWAQTIANSWRMSGDIYDSFDRPDDRCPCTTWDCALAGFHCSVMNILNKVAAFPDKGRIGSWNDLDMLEVGNGGMTDEEYKLHFSMWAIMKSPLIMGTDIRTMTPATLSIYSNPAVLAVSQDPLGSPAYRVWRYPGEQDEYGQGEISLWTGSLSGGDYIVALVNAGNVSLVMNASLTDIFFTSARVPTEEILQTWDAYDLWQNRMDDETALAILNGNATSIDPTTKKPAAGAIGSESARYNSTALSYKDGLAANHPALLGAKVATIQPKGALEVEVPRHGIRLFRIRSAGGGLRKRDEL